MKASSPVELLNVFVVKIKNIHYRFNLKCHLLESVMFNKLHVEYLEETVMKNVPVKKEKHGVAFKILEDKQYIISQIKEGKTISEIKKEKGFNFAQPI